MIEHIIQVKRFLNRPQIVAHTVLIKLFNNEKKTRVYQWWVYEYSTQSKNIVNFKMRYPLLLKK